MKSIAQLLRYPRLVIMAIYVAIIFGSIGVEMRVTEGLPLGLPGIPP